MALYRPCLFSPMPLFTRFGDAIPKQLASCRAFLYAALKEESTVCRGRITSSYAGWNTPLCTQLLWQQKVRLLFPKRVLIALGRPRRAARPLTEINNPRQLQLAQGTLNKLDQIAQDHFQSGQFEENLALFSWRMPRVKVDWDGWVKRLRERLFYIF